MKHKQVPLSSIKVVDRFRQDLGDIDFLKETIEQQGLLQPIVIDDEFTLLAGGRRYEACKQLNWDKIPCVILSTDGKKVTNLEIELIENIARKDMAWHERGLLELNLLRLKQEEDPKWSQRKQAKHIDVSYGALQRRVELARAVEMLPELKDLPNEDAAWRWYKRLEEDATVEVLTQRAREKEDDTFHLDEFDPDTGSWSSDDRNSVRPGEANQPTKRSNIEMQVAGFLKNVASNGYIIGDALSHLKKNRASTAHFAEVDSPYAIDLDLRKDGITNYTEISREEYLPMVKAIAKEVHRILHPDAFMVWWYGQEWYYEVRETLKEAGFSVSTIPNAWYKLDTSGQTRSPDQSFGNCYETFFLCRKGNPKLRKPGRKNVFECKPINPSDKIHKTEKPLPLMKELLETIIFPGNYILVPFLGSGVTLRAAYQLTCRGWGYELDETMKARFLAKVSDDMLGGRTNK